MGAFIHWLAITFSHENGKHDQFVTNIFLAATGLTPNIRNASSRELNTYRASTGTRLTSNGSLLLNFRHSGKLSMIIITGSDCELIQDWRQVRNQFRNLPSAKIARLDLALDVENTLTLNDVDNAYHDGQFSIKGKSPEILHIGQFVKDEGKARTIIIGKRQNGKCMRAYEVGRKLQLSARNSIRLEVELRGSKRIIPFDAITEPHAFFCGAYPFLQRFKIGSIATTDLRKEARHSSYQQMIDHLKNSYGQFLNVMLEVEESSDEIFKKISRPGYPKEYSKELVQLLKEMVISQSTPTTGVESGVESKNLPEIVNKILHHLGCSIQSKLDLAIQLGRKKPNRYMNETLRNMINQGLIEFTIPGKPNSRFQKYRITEKGIVLARSS